MAATISAFATLASTLLGRVVALRYRDRPHRIAGFLLHIGHPSRSAHPSRITLLLTVGGTVFIFLVTGVATA